MKIGSDIDKTLLGFGGTIKPEDNWILITGRTKDQEAETRKVFPVNPILFFAGEHSDEAVGKFKAEMIKKTGINKFYEDSPIQAQIIKKENPQTEVITVPKYKFYIKSEYGELLDLAIHLQDIEGHEVVFSTNHDYKKIGEGIVKKDDKWWNYTGKGYIFCIDGCADGNLQDSLRAKGELVFGGSEEGDKLENDRQLGQKLFKAAGFKQVESHNFKNIDEAIKFVSKNSDKRWILKQNNDAPKSINHMGKFEGNEDMLFHLEELKKKWTESKMGQVDFDLMEVVEGLEVAASVFFNGKEYMKNSQGKVVGFLNFEEKKESDDGMGETCGEMGTTFFGVTEDNKLFADILMKPKILEALRATKFRGVFDINTIKTKDGIVALEPTCRFGIPSTSYEFLVGLNDVGGTIKKVAEGSNEPIEIKQGIGMVMCVVAKPFPINSDEEEQTSIGEKLWILQDKKPIKDFTYEQKKHIHLENFYKDKGDYRVATKDGYLLTVTGSGNSISEIRDSLIKFIKENLYISGMKYRTDIGKRVEKDGGVSAEQKLKKEYDNKVAELTKKHEDELSKIRKILKKTIYE